jgi:hemolysin activation/secretion protein
MSVVFTRRHIRFNRRTGAASRVALLAAGWLMSCLTQAADSPQLTAAVIQGSTVYSQVDLFSVYRGQLGKIADSTAARAVIAQIESLYARDGYVKPLVTVQGDLLADGILRVDLREIWLADVTVEGKAGPYARRVTGATRPLLEEKPLRASSIPDVLRELRALPGLEVAADVAERSDSGGGVILNLKARYRPVAVTMQWSHRGTSEVGPGFFTAQLVESNLLHARERLGAFVTATRNYSEYHAVGAFLELPVGRRGPVLGVTAVHSSSQPTFNGLQYDLFYPQDSATFSVRQRLVGSQRFNLAATFAADLTNSRINFEGEELESDRLRTVQLGVRMDGAVGARGAYALQLNWRRGLDAFGSEIAFIDGSTLDPAYQVGALNAVYAAPLGGGFRWRFELMGQLGGEQLAYVERFKVGGARLGRGLGAATMAGDSGAGASLELAHALRGLPGWLGGLSLYGYADYGTVWQDGAPGRQYVGTSGVGVALDQRSFRLSAEAGRPVVFSGARPDGTSVFGEVQLRF